MIKKLLRKLFGYKTIKDELIEFKYSKPLPDKTKADGMEDFVKKLKEMDDEARFKMLNSGWVPTYVMKDIVEGEDSISYKLEIKWGKHTNPSPNFTEREKAILGELLNNESVRIKEHL